MFDKDVNNMHYTNSLAGFNQVIDEALSRCSLYPQLLSFKNYFVSQWLVSIWVNWSLFSRPYGFSTTINNTEGFNRIIKKVYTSYERNTVLECCMMLVKMVNDISIAQDRFDLTI
ncbi:hypothetical protein BpHYR1_042253 [Brachionus plicatilis]|uniref:Uncharacterized protein n=1 Tax=Brachionus plicatilis TaxID=10195 RepID=A0A3M7SPU3_BRAPC|nr:hypothetical protein BpHYR1_042253 [Brachionus plicatilis]